MFLLASCGDKIEQLNTNRKKKALACWQGISSAIFFSLNPVEMALLNRRPLLNLPGFFQMGDKKKNRVHCSAGSLVASRY